MKHVLYPLIFTFSLLTTNATEATYGFAEGQLVLTKDGATPIADALIGGTIIETDVGSIGWEGFALVTDGWWEAYGGVTYTPIPQLTLSLQAGVQGFGGDVSERFAMFVIVNHDWFSFSGALELDTTGLDGLWYGLIATSAVTEWLKLGIEWRRFVGIGPHVSVSIPETPLTLWATWAPIEPEGLGNIVNLDRMMVGVKIGF